ncbi:VOC family protein [Actibacterium sp. 188UL27-1]|uniref:VOC family protein n=1 Tax=Actibacterium sp. 188UL27-1 TaxID=2786961 RepID=UPI0019562495|nr:VOC family protein [Actibacterium sp. 188UL27-1]MBM7070392.1 VOC family protein [Actibacterium sp. 188UL27-1]
MFSKGSAISISVQSLDHLVLTVTDLDRTVTFYRTVLGMRVIQFQPATGPERLALGFGKQKINLHPASAPFEPKAAAPLPGSADLCFLSDTLLAAWQAHLSECGITVEEGPVPRTGAAGPLTSLYIRDPDGNLIEISNQM